MEFFSQVGLSCDQRGRKIGTQDGRLPFPVFLTEMMTRSIRTRRLFPLSRPCVPEAIYPPQWPVTYRASDGDYAG
jgi:hypothetical protein